MIIVLAAFAALANAQSERDTGRQRAEALIRDHQWDQGIEVLQPLLKTAPADPKLLNLAGLAYTGKGDRKAADRYFEAALKIDRHFVPALKNLGINEAAMGQVKLAEGHFEEASKEAPDDPVVNLYLGEFCYRENKFKEAATYLGRAQVFVSRDPNLLASFAVAELKTGQAKTAAALIDDLQPPSLTARSQIELGIALAETNTPARAIPFLEAARQSYPSAEDISYDLALCYMDVKRFPEAIGLLQAITSAGHETSDIDNLLAEAYEANHETQHAVDALRRAIVLNPGDDDNYLAFASICLDHQDFENAGKVLTVALSVHPRSARLLLERGILNAMQDHFDLAEKDFISSANLAPEDNSPYVGLGITLAETGNAAQATPMLRKRLQDHPNDANLSYLLAETLLRNGAQQGDAGFAEAQKSLEKAVRLNPELVEAHISLGTIYLDEGEAQKAVDQLEEARVLDPKANSAYSHLALAYRRLGQQEKAKEVLRELKELVDQERTGSRSVTKSAGMGSEAKPNATPQGPAE